MEYRFIHLDFFTMFLQKLTNCLKALCLCSFILIIGLSQVTAQGLAGYYQQPDIYHNTIVFVAEGDIWKVSIEGGLGQRITAHTNEEKHPYISPDGKTIAYSASYEGPTEVYTIPIDGGLTKRWTYGSDASTARAWTPDGKIVYTTSAHSKVPNQQLFTLDPNTKETTAVPLFQANDGVQTENGTWFFVPLTDMNGHIKRYQGGWARQIWKFEEGMEAVKLTKEHLGESFNPMWFEDRVYFITDRDGMKNIWSMNAEGEDLKQHTSHAEFDVRSANINEGKIVYQHGADLWILDIGSGEYKKIDIRLISDFEELKVKWLTKPSEYITSVNPDSKGEKVAVTARGRMFVAPVQSGRTIVFTEQKGPVIRHRDAVFSHDGAHIIALSDASGELEFVQFAADGTGEARQISENGKSLPYEGIPSGDGKWLAYDDIEKDMFIIHIATGERKKISTNQQGIKDFSWSPDSQWLAFVQVAMNGFSQIKIYNVKDGSIFDLTNNRSNNTNVKWSPDGQFIYFISDRSFSNLGGDPRRARLGGVGWDNVHKVYHVALQKGARSPFRELDEISRQNADDEKAADKVEVSIDKKDIQSRTITVPIPSGNYDRLEVNDKAIYLLARESLSDRERHLKVAKISSKNVDLSTMASKVNYFELTRNGEKLFIKKGKSYYMVEAGTGEVKLSDEIDLSGCQFAFDPREDWKQLYTDAWRMERDYFYDKNMHGVDWDAMYHKHLPFVDRVTTRNELNDVLAQLIGELSVLHATVVGGDIPGVDLNIQVGSLGAKTSRDEKGGGHRIDYIYKADPDFPERKSPLDDPHLDIEEGDVITSVNGTETLSVADIGELFENQAGKQVRLSIKRGEKANDFIVKVSGNSYWLKYGDWEIHNRLRVDKESNEEIGYLHLSANSDWDIGQFYREYFPVANKRGLIIDMRYNAGGYISGILLQLLSRQVWMYRVDRTGQAIERVPHMVVLVNERTGSDGEGFAEGFRRLGLEPTIGMRTWGGFIALSFNNRLSDKGVAAAPRLGGYGPEGTWLLEGIGHIPDIEVDNLPYETFKGKDAQLEAAIAYLQQKIAEDPRDIPLPPAYPDKSFNLNYALE